MSGAVRIDELRFLVVEDHGFQRWMLGNMLGQLGARFVFLAPDGRAALNLFTSLDTPVDIVVTDLDMPHMDGMEFIRRLGEIGIPVSLIITSGLEASLVASVEVMARAYGVHLLGTIAKPANPKVLAEVIERHTPAAMRADSFKPAAPVFTLAEILAGLDNDEFEPFFQPKIEIASGAVRGAEVLARWRHPRHGVVAPYTFVKTLEDGGHIDRLTWVMLKKSARECSAWHAAGLGGTISVNLSLKSLDDPRLSERVTEIVTREHLTPRDVILEVTESAPANHLGAALENLSRLRMKGFGLSIDDYGTGHSSLQQLSRIPFTELKIDQSFVRNGSRDLAGRIMLESSLEIASKLKIVAVAEGVEMLVDWDLMKKLNCEVAQGYFIALPMNAAAYSQWFRARSKRM